ncbi:hypothetical protein DOY81_001375 [Sarcophaga bullata]|nr:hypothetical protein DOY81_001375 [Sarcophaga bullata]
MAKVKESIKKNSATTKLKAEPAKANPGKVRKLRINVKRVKKSNEPKIRNKSENTSEVSPKLKLCVVKLRRTRINSSYVKENKNNDNTNKKNNDTLQAQCKSVELEGSEASKESTKTSARRIRESKASNHFKSGLEKNISNEEHFSKSSRNHSDKIKPIARATSAKEIEGNKAPTTPSCTKRCAVRLQRTPITNEMLKFNNKNSKIRLRTIPIQHKEDQAIERTESQDDSLERSNTSSILPVIDKDKRENFLKLSLTRTSIKESNKMNKQQKLTDNTTPLSISEVKENTPEKNYVLPQLKHVPSLSLRKTMGQNMTNISINAELTQFDHTHEMTTYFAPLRNSTVLISNRTNETTIDKNSESKTVDAKPDNTQNCRSLDENLANKPDEIENLLNSLDDDDPEETNENNKNNETAQVKSALSKTNKFFHYRKENLHEDISIRNMPKPIFKAPIKHQDLRKENKRKPSKKRSSLKNSNDIYEFLSQSQTSDCDGGKRIDPTADIIKKLMDQGKVRVATISKGKGRPMFKRKIPHKQMKRIKQTGVNKPKQLKNKLKTVTISENVIEHQAAEDDHFQDHFDDHFDHDSDNDNIDLERVNHKNRSKNLTNNSKHDQEGTFSRLAKSVLINQTGRSDLQRKKNASNLLEMVKKYISTPKNKQPLPDTTLHPDFSPIYMPSARPATKASPWRVDEDAHLPRLFNFTTSSANLPSYSSDFIPSTPRKEKSNHNHIQVLQEECVDSSDNISVPGTPPHSPVHDNSEERTQTQMECTENEPSVISSFSSNDSNAENIAPHNIVREGINENNNIFDLKQFPNPRRALSYRSPLKTINILEVVHLPPLKTAFKPISPKKVNNVKADNCGLKETIDHDSLQAVHNVVDVRKSPQQSYTKDNTIERDLFGFEENICHDSLRDVHNVIDVGKSPQKTCIEESNESIEQDLFGFVQNETDVGKSLQKNCIPNNNNLNKEDLFGFEEFLSQTNVSSQEYNSTNDDNNANTGTGNVTIHDKLQDLAKLKPESNELLKEKLNYCVNNRHLFENEATSLGDDGKRQRNIKEMLCSTMIHHQQPSTSKEALKSLKNRNEMREDCDLSELFKDHDPETTFNENEAHRTYVRPHKRKRRLNEKNLVIYLDSDDSGEEENFNSKQKHNHSNETTDTSSENVQKKKRKRKAPKVNHELDEFVDEFNKMCKEVDSYELMVE